MQAWRRWPAVVAAATVAVVLAGCGSSTPSSSAAAARAPTTSSPTSITTSTTSGTTPATGCDGRRPPAAGAYAHVLVIVMENHDFAQVAGHSAYLNGLAARCGLATDHHGVSHPSLPNYIALTSGGTQGITTDCTSCSTGAASIFGQVGDGGWKSYEEGMPSAGFTGASSGRYVKRHNPPAYFTAVASAYKTRSVPMGTVASGALATDLRTGDLPKFAFLTPDLCNDEHDCDVSTGDAWLASWVPAILASPAYQAGNTALFVTYDEDDNLAANHVYTVVVAPSVRPGTSAPDRFDHYALLATMEDMLGLPRLGSAAQAPTMRAAFNL